MKDLYGLLGVSPDATLREIKIAFRKKAFSAHPDRGGSPELMQDLNLAHEILSDPNSRKLYDSTWAEHLEQKSADEIDADPTPDLSLERIGSFDVSISEKLRQKHAEWVATYQNNPLNLLDEQKTNSPSAAIAFFRKQGHRHFDSQWHPVENETTFHPLELFKLKMDKGMRAVPLIKGFLDSPLDVPKACAILTDFIECDYYGQNFHDVMAYLDREIQHGTTQQNERDFFKAVHAILLMGLHPEERHTLFQQLTVITDYASKNAWTMMGLFSRLFQNQFFRNLYLIALEQHWQQHGRTELLQDLAKFETDEKEYQAHAQEAFEHFKDALEQGASKEHLEWLRHLRVSAKILCLYEKRSHVFSIC